MHHPVHVQPAQLLPLKHSRFSCATRCPVPKWTSSSSSCPHTPCAPVIRAHYAAAYSAFCARVQSHSHAAASTHAAAAAAAAATELAVGCCCSSCWAPTGCVDWPQLELCALYVSQQVLVVSCSLLQLVQHGGQAQLDELVPVCRSGQRRTVQNSAGQRCVCM